jgi:FKBP-type peptidyl-prolyl cis-trans isomerase (trigger factor)
MDKQYKYTKSLSKDDETIIECSVNADKFQSVKEKIFRKMSSEVKLPGFRPGKAPKALIESQISGKVLDETLNTLIPDVTAEIMEESDITPLNQVRYELVKVSDSEGLTFKAMFVAMPEFKITDVSKIKIKKEVKQVKDEDVANETTRIFQYYTKAQPQKEGEQKPVEQKLELKDITDEKVKALNIGFNDLKSLQEQIRKELESSALRNSEVKYLDDLLKETISKSKVKAPKHLVEQSAASKEKEYLKKLEDLNLKLEEFLKVQKTSMEKLREQWKNEAENRFNEELLLLKIIKEQKFNVTDAEVDAEIAKITDPATKEQFTTDEGKRYLITVLLQQKAMTWLKDQAAK